VTEIGVFVTLGFIVASFWVFFFYLPRVRREAVERFVQRHGLEHLPGKSSLEHRPIQLDPPAFPQPIEWGVFDVMRGREHAGVRWEIFRYWYRYVRKRRVESQSQLLLQFDSSKLGLPIFWVRFNNPVAEVLYRDQSVIDFSSEDRAFHRAFRVSSKDEAAVRSLFTSELRKCFVEDLALRASSDGVALSVWREDINLTEKSLDALLSGGTRLIDLLRTARG
jgi:hypothetical protein